MSINSRIISALDGIVSVEPDDYTGSENEYATVNYDEIGDDHGDDTPQHTRFLIQVHYFAPIAVSTLDKRQAIKLAIHRAGFTVPDVQNVSGQDRYENPIKRQHFIYEFEDIGETGL